MLINTSFNARRTHVCTPKDAHTCFMRTNIDAWFWRRYLLHKQEQEDWIDTGNGVVHQPDSSRKEGLRFAFTLGAAFLFFGAIAWYRDHMAMATALWRLRRVVRGGLVPTRLGPVQRLDAPSAKRSGAS